MTMRYFQSLKEELADVATVAKFAIVQSEGEKNQFGQKLPTLHLFDTYKFVTDLIRTAKKSILLIDNYIDDSILLMLSKRDKSVIATIYTHTISHQLKQDVQKHNSQYPPIEIKTYKQCHDCFLIIDDTNVYHIGAS